MPQAVRNGETFALAALDGRSRSVSVVGIDLGTTNTVAACVRAGQVHTLADEHGARLLPSVVSFHPSGEVLVGAAAKARRIIDPRNTVYSHKRLLGRSWGSPEIARARERSAFELLEGPGQGLLVRARARDYTLPEISAFVLRRARQIAEAALGEPVPRVVITVPAHFNELQRASTKVAGRVAGLEVLRILNEPTAAALAYGFGRKGRERIAVYDFGGGTFDCTLLDLNGNVFEVLATSGDSFLGGDDIDALIADRMAETFLTTYRQDPRSDPQIFERLKAAAEDVKIALSSAEEHSILLNEFGHATGGAAIDFAFTMTRRDLEAMIEPLVANTFNVTQDALTLAGLTVSSFDNVILVGGTTKIPSVQKRIASFFGREPLAGIHPDEVVAMGAAIQAIALTGQAQRRKIPPPPPVPTGAPRTLPGVRTAQGDPHDTGEESAAKHSRSPATTTLVSGPSPAPHGSSPRPADVVEDGLLGVATTPERIGSDDFGHVSDLSLVSGSISGTLVTSTQPYGVSPSVNPPRNSPGVRDDARAELIDLPVALEPTDLPSVVSRSRPPGRESSAPRSATRPSMPPPLPRRQAGATELLGSPAPGRATSSVVPGPMPARTPGEAAAQRADPPPATPRAIHGPQPVARPSVGLHGPSTEPIVARPVAGGEPEPEASFDLGGVKFPSAPVLVDVTPRALVVETAGGFADTIIARNAKIPCERTRRFSTGRDLQTSVRVRVAQGENAQFATNTFLGELELSGLRPAPRGQVVVAVSFEVDADGTLRVEARDHHTGQAARAVLQLVGVADESSVVAMMSRFQGKVEPAAPPVL